MQLSTGARLGTYEIIGLLGAGGMGEVYRALDTKLNRHVAIKLLPDAYASDPDRVARFHREAQAVAALNHPNIAAIHDFAESGATKFLVLELVEGDTLADRLQRGPLPVEEALAITRQTLEALEAAHEKSICHRDLKPANIKVNADGQVKILDFGLAKFLQPSPTSGTMANSPTLSVAGTYPGVILGTAGYMSPEQARGFDADHRSDLFSVGCILYEMLTGRHAFEGDTASDILAGVLKSDVDMSALPPRLHPRLVELLRRCLEKNPKKRWHAAADVRVEVEALMARPSIVDELAAVHDRRSRWGLLALAATAIIGAALGAATVWFLKPEPARMVTRFIVALPGGQQFTNPGRQLLALTPDGANLIYVANQRLFVRPLSGLEAREIAGSAGIGVLSPAISPDGSTIAYWSQGDLTLKRIAINGGAAVTIAPTAAPHGMSWSEQGIVFGQLGKGIMRVSPNGGTPELIAGVDDGMVASMPQMLPGGAILFSLKKQTEPWDAAQVVVQNATGDRKVLLERAADARYLATGHLVYASSGMLLVVPFDLKTLAVSGGAVPIVEGVRRAGITGTAVGLAQYTFSNNGTLAYVPGSVSVSAVGDRDLAIFDLKGTPQPLKLPPGSYRAPRVSPDGRFVAFDTEDDREPAVWVYEIAGSTAARRLTFGGRNQSPVWSPDGQWLAFESTREGDAAIFRQRADGSGTAERITSPAKDEVHIPHSWSPDGAHLLYAVHKPGDVTLWTWSFGDRKGSPFGGVRSVEAVDATFSPNGRWVAYQTRESDVGRPREVYLQPFPATGVKYLVGQGGHPSWTGKGAELIINTGPGRSTMFPVVTSPQVKFGRGVDLLRNLRAEPNPALGRRNADPMPDGQRILGVLLGSASSGAAIIEPHITVVINWFEDVRTRAPRN